jgi:hypothetical protein
MLVLQRAGAQFLSVANAQGRVAGDEMINLKWKYRSNYSEIGAQWVR